MILDKKIEIVVGARNLPNIKKYYPDASKGLVIIVPQILCLEVAKCKNLECVCDQCGREYTQTATRIIENSMREFLCGECMFLYGQENMRKTVKTKEFRKLRSEKMLQFHQTEYGKNLAKKVGKWRSEYLKSRTDLHDKFTLNLPRMYGKDHPNFNPNKTEFSEYIYKVRIITENTYKDNINTINPNGYQRILCGVKGGYQLDHIISVKQGFDEGISPDIIGGLNNLQMLPWEENRNKWHK